MYVHNSICVIRVSFYASHPVYRSEVCAGNIQKGNLATCFTVHVNFVRNHMCLRIVLSTVSLIFGKNKTHARILHSLSPLNVHYFPSVVLLFHSVDMGLECALQSHPNMVRNLILCCIHLIDP